MLKFYTFGTLNAKIYLMIAQMPALNHFSGSKLYKSFYLFLMNFRRISLLFSKT